MEPGINIHVHVRCVNGSGVWLKKKYWRVIQKGVCGKRCETGPPLSLTPEMFIMGCGGEKKFKNFNFGEC